MSEGPRKSQKRRPNHGVPNREDGHDGRNLLGRLVVDNEEVRIDEMSRHGEK